MKFLKIIILSLFLFPLNHVLSEVKEELVFCFVGDAGEVTQSQTEVTTALHESDCSLIWYLGDITQPGIDTVDDPEFIERFLNPFEKVLEQRKVLLKFALDICVVFDFSVNPQNQISCLGLFLK